MVLLVWAPSSSSTVVANTLGLFLLISGFLGKENKKPLISGWFFYDVLLKIIPVLLPF